MPKVCYIEKKFNKASLQKIEWINSVIERYKYQGLELTLRQVYYQLVAKDLIENTERSYKNIGTLVSEARLAGLIDWNAIVDRTRGLRRNSHFSHPSEVISAARFSYMLDRWENQPNYVEVWIEKDALVGIVSRAASPLDVPYFSCRGYTSQSEMWIAAQRFRNQQSKKKRIIIHLGDHDPSGIDMTRDIQDRLNLFGANVQVKRVALTMEQIEAYNPPPNPAKITDSRAKDYIEKYGNESWELDALEPQVIIDLIRDEIEMLINYDKLDIVEHKENKDVELLKKIENNYEKVAKYVRSLPV